MHKLLAGTLNSVLSMSVSAPESQESGPGHLGTPDAELLLPFAASTVLLAVEECRLVDTRMGWGEAPPGLEGGTCLERKVDFAQPGRRQGFWLASLGRSLALVAVKDPSREDRRK